MVCLCLCFSPPNIICPVLGCNTIQQDRVLLCSCFLSGPAGCWASSPGNAPSSSSSLLLCYWVSSPCVGCSSVAQEMWLEVKGLRPSCLRNPVCLNLCLSFLMTHHGGLIAWQYWFPSGSALKNFWPLCHTCITSSTGRKFAITSSYSTRWIITGTVRYG